VLSPEDNDNPQIPDLTRQALPVSNLSRIEPEPVSGEYPPSELFGAEPEHTWCYYYQKAELAVQFRDWERAAALGDDAQARGYAPTNPFEWLPLIQGYTMSRRWEAALDRSRTAFGADEAIAPSLCRLWDEAEVASNPEQGWKEPIQQLKNQLQCTASQDIESSSTSD
jgi:hypothetical protein